MYLIQKIKSHIADLNDVSSSVWFWQSAHHHVRVSDRLNLTTQRRIVLYTALWYASTINQHSSSNTGKPDDTMFSKIWELT